MNTPKLTPEQKVTITLDITDAATRICADGIRDKNPQTTDEELIEEIRRRITKRRSE